MRRVSCAVAVLAAAVLVTTLAAGAGAATGVTQPIGTVRQWPQLDVSPRPSWGSTTPRESTARYATYRLTVNGVVQPGGS
jgi:hypothetical protein